MTKPINHWTPANDAELRRLAAEKKTAREIGALLGRSKNSVVSRARRKEIPLIAQGPRKRKPLLKKQIVYAAQEAPSQTKVCVLAATIPDEPKPIQFEPFLRDGVAFTTQSIPFGRCRWIDDIGATADSPMCGHEVYADGKPWCSHHRVRATTIVAPRKDPVQEAMRRWG